MFVQLDTRKWYQSPQIRLVSIHKNLVLLGLLYIVLPLQYDTFGKHTKSHIIKVPFSH